MLLLFNTTRARRARKLVETTHKYLHVNKRSRVLQEPADDGKECLLTYIYNSTRVKALYQHAQGYQHAISMLEHDM